MRRRCCWQLAISASVAALLVRASAKPLALALVSALARVEVMAEAAAGSTASTEGVGSGKRGPRTYRAADGTVFVYDATSRAWRVQEQQKQQDCSEEACVSSAPLAIAWRQFDAKFDGDFEVAGAPVLLASPRALRAPEEQQDADTGRSVWDGALCLAKLLERNPELVRGRSVLEVGAGRGVVGLSAALLGASSVTLTDLSYSIEGAHDSAGASRSAWEARGVQAARIAVEELDWRRPELFLQRNPDLQPEVIIGADVIWLDDLVEPLVFALRTLAATSTADVEVIIVYQVRSERTGKLFLELMANAGFDLVRELPGGLLEQRRRLEEQERAAGEWLWHEAFVPDERMRAWSFRFRLRHRPADAAD